jgi:HPt (histidine-containing phosphotransfer) domain-containing protein
MAGLVHDLASIATGIGAAPLAHAATQLAQALAQDQPPEHLAEAQARVNAAITPVVVALSKAA